MPTNINLDRHMPICMFRLTYMSTNFCQSTNTINRQSTYVDGHMLVDICQPTCRAACVDLHETIHRSRRKYFDQHMSGSSACIDYPKSINIIIPTYIMPISICRPTLCRSAYVDLHYVDQHMSNYIMPISMCRPTLCRSA